MSLINCFHVQLITDYFDERMDVWKHVYYLRYNNARDDGVNAIFDVCGFKIMCSRRLSDDCV